ncbi:zinc finger protein 292a [Diretmus argenteus]
MAEGETEREYDTRKAIEVLRERFQGLTTALKDSSDSPLEASLRFCQEFCQVLVEHAGRWKTDEDPLPLLEVYTVAILSFAKAASCLSSECENVPLLLEKLALSCVELLLLLPQYVPGALWEEFQSSMKLAHSLLQESSHTQLRMLSVLAQQDGVWSNATLTSILSNETPQTEKAHEFLELEGPTLLNMRIKHLIKVDSVEKAAVLAKLCSEYPGYEGKGNFKQTYLVCICMTKSQEQLMEEIASIDCKDALEMICNLESEEDEKGALCLCSAFLKRQLLQGDVYCAWELTLFWSKLLMRLESSADAFLDQSKKMALLCRSVCHILFLIKVVQNEVGEVGLPVCAEMCIQALKMTSGDHKDSKSTICKTIHCLLPTDLEVKRACQLTEFLLQPTVDSYYAVESLYNEPDQKPEEEGSLPVPNSLRCELLLALKTQWPFDPEFWDWKTLKRNCLALMGEEAAIVSSIDTLNDTDAEQEAEGILGKAPEYKDLEDFLLNTTNELNEITDEREKNREAKKLREQGFVSARFRNWRAYMQYCVLCDKEFLGHRIVRHAQKHFKDGVYLCPICADSFQTREVLEPHVASHVKQSCKERLAAMKTVRKVSKPIQSPKSPSKHLKVAAKTNISPVKIEPSNGNHTNADNLVDISHVKLEQATSVAQISQDCFCPVRNCSKAFKFFRNLMAHVRCHKDDEEATRFLEIQKQKVVCQYCRRQFVNVKHLNDHLQMHCGAKPYICIQLDCKANFNSNSELLMHRKMHSEFKAQCMFPNCGKIFNEAYLLYDHEAQHYLTYTCQTDNCGKVFYSQTQFMSHQENHGTNHTVHNVPSTNENLPAPLNVEPSLQSTPNKEDQSPAFICLERIDTEAHVKEASMASPSRSPQVAKDPGPVRVKHSIESMLNSVMNSVANPEAKEPEKCYTPLTNPTPAPVDMKPAPEVLHPQHNVAGPDENLAMYAIQPATNPVAGQQTTDQQGCDHEEARVLQKELPQIISPSQIKTENPCSLQGYPPSTPAVTGSEETLHCCPYNDCTRAYSTNKSLSRHVKKQHPEIFEDWKLAKKYNKVAKITAGKVSTVGKASPTQSQNQSNRPSNQLAPLCNKTGMQQMDYPMGCSSSPAPCYPGSMDPVPITPMVNPTLYPSWGSPANSGGLMQSDLSQAWSSPPMNNYPDAFNMNEYPSRSYPPWQTDPYQTTAQLPPERDLSLAAIHGGTMPQVTSDSSLMSQYVSSSLMLDNGGQMHNGGHQYGLMHTEVSGDSVDVTKGNASGTGQLGNDRSISTVDSLPGGSYHTPYGQNSTSSPTQRSSVDTLMKCLSPEAQVALKATTEIIKTENMASSGYEQIDNTVDGMLSPHSIIHTDFPYEEDCTNVESEATPSEEKTGDPEIQKGKRSRLSKRTKWPAIIKDGKVICRRCFREFTSTKSLGGHLSKRSQCKPLDEIDLTADLPTSFLDFLNDPHVPDNGAIYMSNGEFSQETSGLTTLTSPMVMKQEPQNTYMDSYSSNTFSVSPEDQPTHTNSNRAEKALNVPRQEDHLMEISKAFQRLDLIEAAHEKMLGNVSLQQNVSHSDPTNESDKSKTLKTREKREDQPREKLPKPFKCDQDDCEYSFMTKEALFKHLSKMHDYSNERIEELKRTPVKLSPYPCQICPKTFTRTTGLRIHYEKVHRLSKQEMHKLKISPRNRRVFRLTRDDEYSSHADTEANISDRMTTSALMLPAIKQEPLDIAIEPQTNNESNVNLSEITTVGHAESLAHDISTVTRLPSPQNYLSDRPLCELTVPSVSEQVPEEPKEAVREVSKTPDLKETPGQVGVTWEHRGKSDASPLSNVKEPESSLPVASASSSPEKPSSSKNTPTKDEPQRREKPQKKLGLKMCDTDNAFSPYRPYRCVHEGCTAAFTIQQNLILHYRAMHQASLPPSKGEAEVEKTDVKNGQESIGKDNEVRCQVKDCSRVFMGIPRLVQHYLLLHKFTRDKATAMMANMSVETFNCDRPECSLPFDSVEKYIEHIKNYHKEIAISESGTVDPTFKCEYEACDRVYTTKSNLLRHLIKKHDYVYDPKSNDGRRSKSVGLFCAGSNGKENVENKFKVKKKNTKKKDGKSIEHWTSFGKPTLKSHEEASAMCTKKSSLQYPCMIIGCDAVERAERNIFKHYVTHGLTERYIEDQRSQFIFCKKYSRSRFKDANKSEGMSSSSSSEDTELEESETSSSKPSEQKTEELVDRIAQEDSKMSNDESAESQASSGTEVGIKRGRPRKPAHPTPACPERIQTLRNRSTVNSSRENSNPSTPAAQEEQRDDAVMSGSFKPLGLEDSFLKFLETSESTHASKRKLSDRSSVELPSKRQHTHKQRSAMRSKIPDELSDCENLIDFRNPLNLKSVSNVKIVMDKKNSDGADLLLKQLQDMKPIVIIKKWLYSGS